MSGEPALPSNHFLSLPRPNGSQSTTVAAHDFDIDTRTGFMPPEPPLTCLPASWEPWEVALENATNSKLQLGDKPDLAEDERTRSTEWRIRVGEMPVLSTVELKKSEVLLRRAHLVLSWIMHFYVNSIPPSSEDIHIPASVALPLLEVSAALDLPPMQTYSDQMLYNWALKSPSAEAAPALDNLRTLASFSGTRDEEVFYLTSCRIEFRGAEALNLMRDTLDEIFVGDTTAIQRIISHLHQLSGIIEDLTKILLSARDGCDPQVFYNDIRPWFKGADPKGRKWIFDGLELNPELCEPTELSGPTAGQSSTIHALDIFLGVDKFNHAPQTSSPADASKPSFHTRMQSYMPRHHRSFLRHLSSTPRPLRALVEATKDDKLTAAYNEAVSALKVFRDAHVRIVAIYIVGPSRKGNQPAGELQGTAGTDAIRFVKGVRDQTAVGIIGESPST